VVNTTNSSFDIEDVMNSGKILLVNVSQGKLGEDNSALLGAMIITKIQLAAMSRVYIPEEERRDFFLYIDEFQNFATNSFVKILSEARKYRLSLILANQYMAQIPDEVKAAIFGNAGSMISFILGAQDADWMQKEFGNKYTQEDLVSLGRYQVVNKLMIHGQVSQPFPAYTLNLAASKNQSREKVLNVSRERYAKKKVK
jgi:type IV secretory pathway TraG/TraD family ATPase VirD4